MVQTKWFLLFKYELISSRQWLILSTLSESDTETMRSTQHLQRHIYDLLVTEDFKVF